MVAQALDLLQAVPIELAERRLRHFVRQAWYIIEPFSVFKPNWHLDAIADHLEAVEAGQIRNLLVTMPPRMGKSLTISVFFPAWRWINRPGTRFLYASYSQDLATQHSVATRRVIESDWYQARWGDRFQLAGDANLKTRFENDQRGARFSTSVGGVVTGIGGDRVVCLPADEMVWTEAGSVSIGEIVDKRLQVRAVAYDATRDQCALSPIVGWHENPGDAIFQIGLSDGSSVHCTADHRVWTRNRGWVEAQDLGPFDVLPRPALADVVDRRLVDLEASRESAGTFRRGEDFADLDFSQLSPACHAIGGAADITRDIAPGLPTPDLLNGGWFDAESIGERCGSFKAVSDDSRLLLGKLGSWSSLMQRERSVSFGIVDVIGARAVDEVVETTTGAIAVDVADLVPRWTRSDERSGQGLVNEDLMRLPVLTGVESRVSLARRRFEDFFGNGQRFPVSQDSSTMTAHLPERRDAVESLESGDRSPLFVRFHRYASKTYCITIEGYHNFVGGDNIIVANCDDPHNVKEAESQAIREAALLWWDQAMSTRLNDPKTGARIIVMQRVHEADLAGHVLEQGGYVHLNLPMEYEPEAVHFTGFGKPDPRTDPGQLLAPDRVGPAEVADLKLRLGSRAYAGQFQQRPAPAEGGTFKREWWQRYRIPPRLVKVEQFMDSAFKTGVSNDYSVIATWGDDGQGNLYVLDVWRARVEYPDLMHAAHDQHAKHAHWAVSVPLVIEDQASGQSAIQTLRRPLPVNTGIILPALTVVDFSLPAGMSKEARAEAVSPEVEAKRVFLPEDAPWVADFIEEHAVFPAGAHDDQVDTTSMAIMRLHGGKRHGGGSGSWLPAAKRVA